MEGGGGLLISNNTDQFTCSPSSCSQGGLINFEKRRMEFEVLAKVSLFQAAATQYSCTLCGKFEHWLETTPVLSEHERYCGHIHNPLIDIVAFMFTPQPTSIPPQPDSIPPTIPFMSVIHYIVCVCVCVPPQS